MKLIVWKLCLPTQVIQSVIFCGNRRIGSNNSFAILTKKNASLHSSGILWGETGYPRENNLVPSLWDLRLLGRVKRLSSLLHSRFSECCVADQRLSGLPNFFSSFRKQIHCPSLHSLARIQRNRTAPQGRRETPHERCIQFISIFLYLLQ